MELTKLPYYILFLALFILGQGLSMWGQFFTLPYKDLTMWQAYKMAIPFAWLDWFVMTFTVMVGDKYDLVTPTQDTFLLIIIQFCLILIINHFYLKENVSRSDIIAFGIILLGFFVSFLHIISKLFGIAIPSHGEGVNPDDISASLKTLNYKLLASKSSNELEYSELDNKST